MFIFEIEKGWAQRNVPPLSLPYSLALSPILCVFCFLFFLFVLFIFFFSLFPSPFPFFFTSYLFHSLSPKIILLCPLCWEWIKILCEVPFWWRPGSTRGLSIWFNTNFGGHVLSHLATRGGLCNICGFISSCKKVPGWLPSWRKEKVAGL